MVTAFARFRAALRPRTRLRSAALIPSRIEAARLRRVWAREYRKAIAGKLPTEVVRGTAGAGDLAVIICLWNRPNRLSDLLSQLESQVGPRTISVYFWNNQPEDDAHYRSVLAGYEPAGAVASVHYRSSATNFGGVARFLVAHQLRRREAYSGPFVMLDDDQDIGDSFISDLSNAYRPHSVAGVWAFQTDGTYWGRTQLFHGEQADYVGTGGSICDSALVASDTFLTELPQEYAFMEDIWMSFQARGRGWTLRHVETEYTFVMHESNQYHSLVHRKDEFYAYLVDRATLHAR